MSHSRRLAKAIVDYEDELAALHGPIEKFDDDEYVEVQGHEWKRWLRWARQHLLLVPADVTRKRRGGSR